MWVFDHHLLPDSLASMFTRREEIHTLNLRDTNKNILYTAHRLNNRYGYDSFSHCGSLLLNKLKDLSFYENCYSKSAFNTRYKAFILETYSYFFSLLPYRTYVVEPPPPIPLICICFILYI